MDTRGRKTIVIIANLDTRGQEFIYVKELIESKGLRGLFLDFSMEQEPFFPGDITCDEVAARAGRNIEEVRTLYKRDRQAATNIMTVGATAIVLDLFEKKGIHGVLGIGGATTCFVATSIMHKLPFGLPKVMGTSMASHHYVTRYIGNHDITMHNVVLDIVEMNPLLKAQLTNVVGATVGMVEANCHSQFETTQGPLIAISSFGLVELCTQEIIRSLRGFGYVPVTFHAQGQGDRAMDEMVSKGSFAGVIDLATRGIVEELLGGNCAAGNERLKAATHACVPQVIAPGGLDVLSYGDKKALSLRFGNRPMQVIDDLRTLIQTSIEERHQVARIMAERLIGTTASTVVMIPIKGWSTLNMEGAPLYSPEANLAFVDEFKRLKPPNVELLEVDAHINDPVFARALAAKFDEIYRQSTNTAGIGK